MTNKSLTGTRVAILNFMGIRTREQIAIEREHEGRKVREVVIDMQEATESLHETSIYLRKPRRVEEISSHPPKS